MKPTPLILMAVMVIFAGFALVRAEGVNEANQTKPWISPSVYEELNNSEWVNVGVFVNSVDLIDGIIATLPESDFQLQQITNESGSAFVGNITKEGLSLLADNPNVYRIILNKVNYIASNNPQNQTLPYVDPAILETFQNQTWVRVIAKFPSVNLTDAIISNFPTTDFMLIKKLQTGDTFSANITKKAFDILINDSGLEWVYLEQPVHGVSAGNPLTLINNTENQTNISVAVNQTQIKTPDVAKPKSFFQKIINFFKSLFRLK